MTPDTVEAINKISLHSLVRDFLRSTRDASVVAVRQYSIDPEVRRSTTQELIDELNYEVFSALEARVDLQRTYILETRSAGPLAVAIGQSIFKSIDWLPQERLGRRWIWI